MACGKAPGAVRDGNGQQTGKNMCGIDGFLTSVAFEEETARATLARMTASLAHRGPDGQGIWLDAQAGIALGHRRLAIVDLSVHGRQPMASACGRYVLVFNGEIYNHRALRHELERAGRAPTWRGHPTAKCCSRRSPHGASRPR